MLLLGLILTVTYLILISCFYYGFDKVEEFRIQDHSPKHRFSIIIPFRDEATNLPPLLESLVALDYPSALFELLWINDDSTDASVELIQTFIATHNLNDSWKVYDNTRTSKSPKKDAIRLGVNHSKYDYILTTDADVVLPKYWLDCYDAYLQEHPKDLVVGPVKLNSVATFLDRYQAIDVLSLQGSTIGAFGLGMPFMCNAANMCYNKAVFLDLNPYQNNEQIASGDDVFLLEALLKQNPNQVGYLKSTQAMVSTKPVSSWAQLIHQRQRWASKSKSYRILSGKLVGVLVLLANLWVLLLPVLVMLNELNLKSALLFFLVKFSIDFLLVFKTARYFDETETMLSFLPSSILYPIVSVYVVFLSLIRPYSWKQRRYKS